jgi:hypothetical protein
MKDMPYITVQRVFMHPFQPAYDTYSRAYDTLAQAMDEFSKVKTLTMNGIEPFSQGRFPVATAKVILTLIDQEEKVISNYEKIFPARENIMKQWGEITA